jgi:uncharacterized FlaG/YvyC family protein
MDVSQVYLSRIEAVQQQHNAALRQEPAAAQTNGLVEQKAAREETRQVAVAVQKLNEDVYSGPSRELTIALDPKTRRPLVRIVDKVTGEVVQQIPSEYVLRMAQEAKERLKQASNLTDKA